MAMTASRKLSVLAKKSIRNLLGSPFALGVLTGVTACLVVLLLHLISNRKRDIIFAPIPITNRTIPNGPRVLCMVSTCPNNYRTKAVHIHATWAGRCDRTVYLSSLVGGLTIQYFPDPSVSLLPIIEVGAGDRREDLWDRIKLGLTRVWERYKGDFDYLVKADDDTYFIMENLKKRLSQLDPKTKLLMGHMQENFGIPYMSGGSGYILSAAAVESFVTVGLNESYVPKAVDDAGYTSICDLPHPYETELVSASEDLQLGACAKLLNFQLVPSDLGDGKSTLFPFKLENHVIPDLPFRWWVQHTRECKPDIDAQAGCASSNPISFHYVSPMEMYKLEYLLYTVQSLN